MARYDLDLQRDEKVVKSNEIIQRARYDLTGTQQKFICYLISKVRPEDDDMQVCEVSVEDFCEIIGVDKNHFYSDFKSLIDDFDNRNFWIETGKSSMKFYWFDCVEYLHGEGRIRVALTRNLSKYLLHLQSHFTSYELFNLLGLRSKYAVRLFELFMSYENMHSIKIDVDHLKRLLCIEDKYQLFADLRRRVLTPATTEINRFTELSVSMEEVRTGHRIGSIIFTIEEKDTTEKMKCFSKAERMLDGVPMDQTSLFDRGTRE